jgi:hypothetical protein
LCNHLRHKVRRSTVHMPLGGVRGVGTLGIAAAKVLASYLRCSWPSVDAVVQELVRRRSCPF